ncbi:hypothetical protein NUW54_g1039 [Trametes sanguinea]|uniref:Uncharacterized protein n=1 Tax=Trametes sanguinea TaxID=158606 RepID=A0ACC1QB87_9APHY|nr:hypothetical protein NUW54_g1039 [Trametes sanguinea]
MFSMAKLAHLVVPADLYLTFATGCLYEPEKRNIRAKYTHLGEGRREERLTSRVLGCGTGAEIALTADSCRWVCGVRDFCQTSETVSLHRTTSYRSIAYIADQSRLGGLAFPASGCQLLTLLSAYTATLTDAASGSPAVDSAMNALAEPLHSALQLAVTVTGSIYPVFLQCIGNHSNDGCTLLASRNTPPQCPSPEAGIHSLARMICIFAALAALTMRLDNPISSWRPAALRGARCFDAFTLVAYTSVRWRQTVYPGSRDIQEQSLDFVIRLLRSSDHAQGIFNLNRYPHSRSLSECTCVAQEPGLSSVSATKAGECRGLSTLWVSADQILGEQKWWVACPSSMPDARGLLNVWALNLAVTRRDPAQRALAPTPMPPHMHLRGPTYLLIRNAPTTRPLETPESPKNRFERLETRINELEALLQEKEHGSSSRSQSASLNGFQDSSAFLTDILTNGKEHDSSFSLNGQPEANSFHSGSSLDTLAGAAALGMDMSNLSLFGDPLNYSDSSPSDVGMELMVPAWPKNLPTNPFLRHLVEAFFTFTPSATRMFHVPTFLASLTLPPTHPKFPLPAILHAMCALGSMYTASVDSTPSLPSLPSYYPDGGPALLKETRSFGDQQIRAAKEAMEIAMRTTADLFSVLQAHIIVSLWYWYNARWSEACLAFATSLRYAVPCGLNACPPFDSISSSDIARSSVIPPATNVIEDETRRNTFWIAYMMERHFAAVNNFAMMLDDEDIAQMLPVRGSEFEHGILVPPNDRQWSYQPDVITNHLDDQTDSFVLHVKATLLLSRVKVFNGRYKVKRHLGDPAMQPDPAVLQKCPGPNWERSRHCIHPRPVCTYPMAMLFGSLIALTWRKYWPASAVMYCYAVAAGMIAGEGLGGIANAVLQIAGVAGSVKGTSVGCPLDAYCG